MDNESFKAATADMANIITNYVDTIRDRYVLKIANISQVSCSCSFSAMTTIEQKLTILFSLTSLTFWAHDLHFCFMICWRGL